MTRDCFSDNGYTENCGGKKNGKIHDSLNLGFCLVEHKKTLRIVCEAIKKNKSVSVFSGEREKLLPIFSCEISSCDRHCESWMPNYSNSFRRLTAKRSVCARWEHHNVTYKYKFEEKNIYLRKEYAGNEFVAFYGRTTGMRKANLLLRNGFTLHMHAFLLRGKLIYFDTHNFMYAYKRYRRKLDPNWS